MPRIPLASANLGSRLVVALLTFSVCSAVAVAVRAGDSDKAGEGKTIAGWGTWVDPDGDCAVSKAGDAVTITVSPAVHDLWPENPEPARRANAPRVLRDVRGDFSAEVTVT